MTLREKLEKALGLKAGELREGQATKGAGQATRGAGQGSRGAADIEKKPSKKKVKR